MEPTPNDLVLVTGATGLVGSHVAERLRSLGVPTRALVRPSADAALLRSWGVEITTGDVADPASLRAACAGATVVVHCAAKVGDWGPVAGYRAVNVAGTRSLIDAALSAGTLRRFVHVSSLGVYPARDHYGTDESTPPSVEGIDGYTRTKAESEPVVLDAARDRGLPAVVLRPGFIYGPRDRNVLPRILGRMRAGQFRYLGSGEQLLNNTYVGNLIGAVLLAIGHDAAVGEAFNVTDAELVTKRRFAGGIARRAGLPEPTKSVPLPVAKAAAKTLEALYRLLGKREAPLPSMATVKFLGLNLDYSIDKARNRLGYAPGVSFDEGMDRTFAWLRAEGLA